MTNSTTKALQEELLRIGWHFKCTSFALSPTLLEYIENTFLKEQSLVKEFDLDMALISLTNIKTNISELHISLGNLLKNIDLSIAKLQLIDKLRKGT